MNHEAVVLDGQSLTIQDLIDITRSGKSVVLSEEGKKRIQKARSIIEEKLANNEVIYGVSTGFGKLADEVISPEEREILQKNLIKSHSIGFGSYIPDEIVLGAMVIEVNSFCRGGSGIRLAVVEMLVSLINNRVIPLVPSIGSLGASGDLSPLAYIARILIGDGEAKFGDKLIKVSEILAKLDLSPLELSAKEGLSLINGTHVLTSYAAHTVFDGLNVIKNSVISVGLTLEAFDGNIEAFSSFIMNLRPHKGQMEFAKALLKVLENSDLTKNKPKRIQDPYSIRCSPQVHGAVLDAVIHCKKLVDIEINSTTDNPLIDIDNSVVASGGNFHGEPIGLAMDYLSIAMTELGNISERRVNLLLDASISGLSPFLSDHPGLNSGLMILQYADTAISAENKVLASPASIDNTSVSANQEDHVSMGLTASKKAYKIISNVAKMIAVEIYTACQALNFNETRTISTGLDKIYSYVRKTIPPLKEDRFFDTEVYWIEKQINNRKLIQLVESETGKLLGEL